MLVRYEESRYVTFILVFAVCMTRERNLMTIHKRHHRRYSDRTDSLWLLDCHEIKFNRILSCAYVLYADDVTIREIRGKRNSSVFDNSISNLRRLINVNDLIEFFVDKRALCQFEHVPIWAGSNFDLSRRSFFFYTKTCRNNYLAIANSICHTMILFLHW